MSICHFSITTVSRGAGQSVVAAAAYRSGERLHDRRLGKSYNYANRTDVIHSNIFFPERVAVPKWMSQREELWNSMEAAHPRKNARLASEFVVTLPHQLDDASRLALAKDYSQRLANQLGVAADLSVHEPRSQGDKRNYHAHILITALKVAPEGWGQRYDFAFSQQDRQALGMLPVQLQIKALRREWAECANEYLARSGLETRIEPRSLRERGIEIIPTTHKGPAAVALERSNSEPVRAVTLTAEQRKHNAKVIIEKPAQLLATITSSDAVFTRQDIAIAVHRYVGAHSAFAPSLAAVMSSAELVQLQGDLRRHRDGHVVEVIGNRQLTPDGHEISSPALRVSASDPLVEPARFTTRTIHDIESGMLTAALQLAGSTQALPDSTCRQVLGHTGDMRHAARQTAYLELGASRGGEFALTAEQKRAVEHVTQDTRLSLVLGVAGAGKSTLLEAARRTWQSAGYEVIGAAVAAKAASGLMDSSGIASRTIESLIYGWDARDRWNPLSSSDRAAGQAQRSASHQAKKAVRRGPVPPPANLKALHANAVLVIDEAGMVDSRTMARLVDEATRTGAKLVLVGDPNQLPAIGAGAAFRTIAERVGHAEVATVYRQREQWQRDATMALSKGRVGEALQAYDAAGHIRFSPDLSAARDALVRDFLAYATHAPAATYAALAYRNADVDALNAAIREGRRAGGHLGANVLFPASRGRSHTGGMRELALAVGDRIHFLANGALEIAGAVAEAGRRVPIHKVDNSDLGTVLEATDGRLIVQLDGQRNGASRPPVVVDQGTYRSIDLGYALTIHKAQGASIDRAYVLPAGLDRALSYVALSRHREQLTIYPSQDTTQDLNALIDVLSTWRFKQSSLDYTRGTVSAGRDAWRKWVADQADERARRYEAESEAREDAVNWLATKATLTKMGPAELARSALKYKPRLIRPSDIDSAAEVVAAKALLQSRQSRLADISRQHDRATTEIRDAHPLQQREARAAVAHLLSAKTAAELEVDQAEHRLDTARNSAWRSLEHRHSVAGRRHAYILKILEGSLAREARERDRQQDKADRALPFLPPPALAAAIRKLLPVPVTHASIEAEPDLAAISKLGWQLNAQHKASADPAERRTIGRQLDALDAQYKALWSVAEARLRARFLLADARFQRAVALLDRSLERVARRTEEAVRAELASFRRLDSITIAAVLARRAPTNPTPDSVAADPSVLSAARVSESARIAHIAAGSPDTLAAWTAAREAHRLEFNAAHARQHAAARITEKTWRRSVETLDAAIRREHRNSIRRQATKLLQAQRLEVPPSDLSKFERVAGARTVDLFTAALQAWRDASGRGDRQMTAAQEDRLLRAADRVMANPAARRIAIDHQHYRDVERFSSARRSAEARAIAERRNALLGTKDALSPIATDPFNHVASLRGAVPPQAADDGAAQEKSTFDSLRFKLSLARHRATFPAGRAATEAELDERRGLEASLRRQADRIDSTLLGQKVARDHEIHSDVAYYSTSGREAQRAAIVAQRNAMIGIDPAPDTSRRATLSAEQRADASTALNAFADTCGRHRAAYHANPKQRGRGGARNRRAPERKELANILRQQADAILADPARLATAHDRQVTADVVRHSSIGETLRRHDVETRRNALLAVERAKASDTSTASEHRAKLKAAGPSEASSALRAKPMEKLTFAERLDRGIARRNHKSPEQPRDFSRTVVDDGSTVASRPQSARDRSHDADYGR